MVEEPIVCKVSRAIVLKLCYSNPFDLFNVLRFAETARP